MATKKKKIIRTIVILLCIVAGGGYIYSSTSKAAANAMAVQAEMNKVQIETVSKGDVSSIVSSTGAVHTEKEYTVSLTTSQEIDTVLVDVGDKVKKDQVLIRYDFDASKKSLERSLTDAKISLESTELSLQNFNLPASADELIDLEENVSSSKRNLEQAKLDKENYKISLKDAQENIDEALKDFENAKILYSSEILSQQEYDNYEKNYNNAVKSLNNLKLKESLYDSNIASAEAALNKAERTLEQGKNPTMTKSQEIQYKQQQLSIESAKIRIDELQSQINDLKDVSTSPIDGIIIEKNVENGDVARESTALLKVTDINNLIVSANVSEFDASNIEIGQPVTITSDGLPDKTYTGKIKFIDPVARVSGNNTGVAIEATIENVDGLLKPGYTVDFEITTASASDVLLVSNGAIQKDSDGKRYVYTVTAENTIKKTFIEIGVISDMYAQVISGLAEGDTIVSYPEEDMYDGMSLAERGVKNGDI